MGPRPRAVLQVVRVGAALMAVQAVLHCMRQPSCAVRPPNSFLLLCMCKRCRNDGRNAVYM